MIGLLGLIAAMSPAEWSLLLSLIPSLIQVGGVVGNIVGQVASAIGAKMATGMSHSEAASALATEGFAVPGWSDAETQKWLDRATSHNDPSQENSNVGSG